MMSKVDGYVHLENGQRLFYQSLGEGTQTVVVPAAHWLASDFNNLADDDRRLLFYDQRGRGGSDPINEDSLVWLDYEVDDIETIRRHFGIGKMSLVGWSYLGACVIRAMPTTDSDACRPPIPVHADHRFR